jgi:hypothetical protein
MATSKNNPQSSAVDAIRGILVGKVPVNFNPDLLREERTTRYTKNEEKENDNRRSKEQGR